MEWEASLIEWLQGTLGDVGTAVSKVLSVIGGETVSLVVVLIILFCYSKEAGKRCGLMLLAASVWFPMIKNVVRRSRPYIEYEGRVDMKMLPEEGSDIAQAKDLKIQGYSFPSGHGAMTVAMYGSAAREIRKKWAWAIAVALPLLIGVSRFVVGVHYPTDVLAGWAVGLAAVGFCLFLEKTVPNENIRGMILLATALPGVFWCDSRDYFTALGALAGMVVAVPYEKKYVNFQDTRKIPVMILRVTGAFAIYYALNILLKLPFSKAWLDSGMPGPNLIRSLRYGIILFTIVGVYPRCFPALERLFTKKEES